MNAVVDMQKASEIMEAVIAKGDLEQLSPRDRGRLYGRVCESVGLNPFTRPFEYIKLNNKLTLYARKDCTDQLRAIHGISVTAMHEREREGVFIITAHVRNAVGRTDVSTGAVSIAGLKGEFLANAMMKAETKAKRRATLSICGLGFLDGNEIGNIPGARRSPRASSDDDDQIATDAAVPSAAEEMEHVDRVPDLATERLKAEDA
jgi:hypothetical protein